MPITSWWFYIFTIVKATEIPPKRPYVAARSSTPHLRLQNISLNFLFVPKRRWKGSNKMTICKFGRLQETHYISRKFCGSFPMEQSQKKQALICDFVLNRSAYSAQKCSKVPRKFFALKSKLWPPSFLQHLPRVVALMKKFVGLLRTQIWCYRPQSLKSGLVLPTQIFGLFGPPKKGRKFRQIWLTYLVFWMEAYMFPDTRRVM